MAKITNSFVNRNIVAIVMIPSLIGIHLVWMGIQKNEALVRKDEQMDLPIVTSAKYLWTKIQGLEKSNQVSGKTKDIEN